MSTQGRTTDGTMNTGENNTIRVFTQEEARRVVDEIVSYMDPNNALTIRVSSWWGAGQRWARNRAALSADQREVTVEVSRVTRMASASASTNQTDSVSLRGIAEHIDFYFHRWNNKIPPDMVIEKPNSTAKGAEVWSDETFNRSVVDNAAAVEQLTRTAESEQLMSSGYIDTTGATALKYVRDRWGRVTYEWGRVTQAQCSATVRHPKGVGSGWAGKTSFDIHRVDISAIARLAFEKCKQSLNPVRIEPGRYTAILEPQAGATMIELLMGALNRVSPEGFGQGPMFLSADQAINRYRSKLGIRIVDERLNIFHEPTAPFVGTHVAPLHGRVDFITNGVLTALASDYKSHLNELSDMHPNLPTTSFTVRGGHTSIDEMISSTKRGLLVARLVQPELLDHDSLLASGVTRDGLWLIENGKITKAVRNFRWTESPLFVLNNVEQIGVEEQVFNPVTTRDPFGRRSFSWSLNNVVVPPIKVNDFSFTSTIDAI